MNPTSFQEETGSRRGVESFKASRLVGVEIKKSLLLSSPINKTSAYNKGHLLVRSPSLQYKWCCVHNPWTKRTSPTMPTKGVAI